MTAHFRTRGVQSVLAAPAPASTPMAVLNELSGAFADFKDRNGNELRELRNSVDRLNSDFAAMRVGGGNTGDNHGTPHAVRQAKDAMASFVRTGKSIAPQAGMSSGGSPDGGYLVDPVLSNEIRTIEKDVSPIAGLARHVELSAGDVFEEIIDPDDVGAAWVGESQARPETASASLKKLSVPLHESYTLQSATQRLIDDSRFDIAGWLTTKILGKFANLDGKAFIEGDGLDKPRGLLTYPTDTAGDATRTWGVIQHVKTGASGTFSATNPADTLIETVYKLRAPYRKNARWLMNRNTASVVRKFKDLEGRYVWSEALSASQPPMLLGFPVELDEEMPDLSANSLSIAFGDFQQAYVIAERPGIRLLRDPYTSKPNVLFYAYRRVGGGVQNSEAVKLVKFST